MVRAVRQTNKPCVAFKILAAGRLSERRQWVEQAYQQTFEAIKPSDAVIVGMYDRYSDQPAENAALVRRTVLEVTSIWRRLKEADPESAKRLMRIAIVQAQAFEAAVNAATRQLENEMAD